MHVGFVHHQLIDDLEKSLAESHKACDAWAAQDQENARKALVLMAERDAARNERDEVQERAEKAEAQLAVAREALTPFAEFFGRMQDGPDYSYMDDRVKDWLGVSDFKAAALEKLK